MKRIWCGAVLILTIAVINIRALDDDDEDLVVQLINPNGKIKGHVLKSAKNSDFYAFQEIPFAQPPTGVNRFQDPKPAQGWEGILETTKNTKKCIQQDIFHFRPDQNNRDDSVIITEDCLYLNVYTPVKPNSTASLPVYVWIYGGAFSFGAAVIDDVNPSFFMDFDVIVVSMNYRVGALGFLTTDDENLPGNLGLKDQQLAIQWTAQNIQLFGGDPKKITVGGESAGSWSSSFQLLTPKNKGLISGVIQQSGSALGQAGYTPNFRNFAFKLGKLLNSSFDSTDSKDLREVLLQASAEDIKTKQSEVVFDEIDGVMTDLFWTPIIENVNNPNAIITSNMLQDVSTGNFNLVPTLIGFNSEEALSFAAQISGEEQIARAKKYDEDPSLLIKPKIHVTNRVQAGKQLKKLYTNGSFEEDIGAFIRLSSSNAFTRPTLKQAEECSKYAPVYVYELAYSPTRSSIPGTENVGHGVDLSYFWNPSRSAVNETIQNQLLTLWTNFIKYQNPTPKIDEIIGVKWPKVETGNIVYLNINETLEVRTNPKQYNEVRHILDKYILPPYIVY